MTPDMKREADARADPARSAQRPEERAGTVAMARTGDPNSATSQFFINVTDNDFLDSAQSRDGNGYTVFGKVVEGMDVVDKIRGGRRPASKGPHAERAASTPVVIKKATPGEMSMTKHVEADTPTTATSRIELDDDEGAEDGRQLPRLRQQGPLRRHRVPPRDQGLHDPGRRLRARHEAEADRRADRERGQQRPEERQVHGGDGAHHRPALGDRRSSSSTSPTTASSTTTSEAQDGWGYAVFGKVVEGTDVVDADREASRPAARASTTTCRSKTSDHQGRGSPGLSLTAAFDSDLKFGDDIHVVDFISDIHLSETMPATAAAWEAYMAATRADAVFLLGDIFEVWVGDDVTGAYSLTFGGLLLTAGSIADRFGRRRVLQVGLAAFGLMSLAGLSRSAAPVNSSRCAPVWASPLPRWLRSPTPWCSGCSRTRPCGCGR